MEDSSDRKSDYPILKLTEWPKGMVGMFDGCRKQRGFVQDHLCGPVNRLLYWALGGVFEFMVSPQPSDDASLGREFIIHETTTGEFRPVFLVVLNDDLDVNFPSRRLQADVHIRERLMDILPKCSFPKLIGLSMLGTATRVYRCNKRTSKITSVSISGPSSAMEGEWGVELMSPEGFSQMKNIVEQIIFYSELLKKKK